MEIDAVVVQVLDVVVGVVVEDVVEVVVGFDVEPVIVVIDVDVAVKLVLMGVEAVEEIVV